VIPAFAYQTGLGFSDHHAFDYLHQPPSATEITDLELPSLHPLEVYSTVLAAIEQRLKILWTSR